MSAFTAAMDALAADPNIGTTATYRTGGTGAPVLLRVVRSAPDRLGDAFGKLMPVTGFRIAFAGKFRQILGRLAFF